jgi:hypothetical protein
MPQERVTSSRHGVNPGVTREMSNYNLRPRSRGRAVLHRLLSFRENRQLSSIEVRPRQGASGDRKLPAGICRKASRMHAGTQIFSPKRSMRVCQETVTLTMLSAITNDSGNEAVLPMYEGSDGTVRSSVVSSVSSTKT